MEIQQLRGFYYSARIGSLTKAAEKLSITQSAVSQQIRSLEEELGVKLFNRIGPRKELTPDGEIFLDLISDMIQNMDSLKTMFEDQKGSQAGLMTLAATTLMIMDILPDTVKHFIRKYPHVRIIILERRWDEVVSLMQAGDIDFGIGPIRSIPSNIHFIEIEPYERVLITSPDHPLAQKRNVTLEDIAAYPMIAYEKGLITRGEIDRVFKEAELDVEIIMEATNAETIKRYIETGIGVAIIPKIALYPTQKHQLKVINVNRYFGKLHYGVILRKGKYLTSWAKNFLHLLDPALKEQLE